MSAISQTTDDLQSQIGQIAKAAKNAAQRLALAADVQKNQALLKAASLIRERCDDILAQNQLDMSAAQDKPDAFLDRLLLTKSRIEQMAIGLEEIAKRDDPVGKTMDEWTRPNGLTIQRVSVPLGVIGIIYESRPNVTCDAAGLCIKSGNAAILRGGSESFHSAKAIAACIHDALTEVNLPAQAVQLLPSRDRAGIGYMLQMDEAIDVIIPRGGRSLIEYVAANSKIPVLKHLDGICHIYVDASSDASIATDVVFNAKMRRPGICGATETLLIDQQALISHAPMIIEKLLESGCRIKGDDHIMALDDRVEQAVDEDWDTEYLDAILSVKIVQNVDQAMTHINRHGSGHTDAIISQDAHAIQRFQKGVNSAIVMVNASTQFADGGEFGLGAEIGISTGKLHARGPVGADQLTTYQYRVIGTGQTRT